MGRRQLRADFDARGIRLRPRPATLRKISPDALVPIGEFLLQLFIVVGGGERSGKLSTFFENVGRLGVVREAQPQRGRLAVRVEAPLRSKSRGSTAARCFAIVRPLSKNSLASFQSSDRYSISPNRKYTAASCP